MPVWRRPTVPLRAWGAAAIWFGCGAGAGVASAASVVMFGCSAGCGRRLGSDRAVCAIFGATSARGGRVALRAAVGAAAAVGASALGSATARATWSFAVACRAAAVAVGRSWLAWLSLAMAAGRVTWAAVLAATVGRAVCRRGVCVLARLDSSTGVCRVWRRAIRAAFCCEAVGGSSAMVRRSICRSVVVRRTGLVVASTSVGSCCGGRGVVVDVTLVAAVARSGRGVALARRLGSETGVLAVVGRSSVRNSRRCRWSGADVAVSGIGSTFERLRSGVEVVCLWASVVCGRSSFGLVR